MLAVALDIRFGWRIGVPDHELNSCSIRPMTSLCWLFHQFQRIVGGCDHCFRRLCWKKEDNLAWTSKEEDSHHCHGVSDFRIAVFCSLEMENEETEKWFSRLDEKRRCIARWIVRFQNVLFLLDCNESALKLVHLLRVCSSIIWRLRGLQPPQTHHITVYHNNKRLWNHSHNRFCPSARTTSRHYNSINPSSTNSLSRCKDETIVVFKTKCPFLPTNRVGKPSPLFLELVPRHPFCGAIPLEKKR